MNKEQLEGLHALFLSASRLDWELAATMCSEADFEAVMDMEVERLVDGGEYKLVVRKDPTVFPRIQVVYKYNIMLGGLYETKIFAWASAYTGGCMVGVHSRFRFLGGGRVFSETEYTEHYEEFAAGNPFRICTITAASCRYYEHIEKSFAAELRAVKEYWRHQLKALKVG